MTFMESIYTELKDNHITTNSEDFSTRFLRKSPHYYSAMKSKGSDATTDVLIDLATAMSTQREFLQQYDTTTIYETRWQKWIDIEAKVAKELALRATKRGTMSNYALNQFKNALQSITRVQVAAITA